MNRLPWILKAECTGKSVRESIGIGVKLSTAPRCMGFVPRIAKTAYFAAASLDLDKEMEECDTCQRIAKPSQIDERANHATGWRTSHGRRRSRPDRQPCRG